MPVIRPSVGIHTNLYLLAGLHSFQLGFLEICRHPDIVERHHAHQRLAGLHQLLSAQERLTAARVIIVVAGMEGALPSVVGGLVGVPVIAVPTSVGYGAAFEGLAALLGMMNSCASNVSVVNIDNGFGAGYMAGMINLLGKVGA